MAAWYALHLPVVYAVEADETEEANAAFIRYLEQYSLSKPSAPTETRPCKFIKNLLKLFPLKSYAKVETQQDAILFLADKVKNARYDITEAIDQYAAGYEKLTSTSLSKWKKLRQEFLEKSSIFLKRAEAIVNTMNQQLVVENGKKYIASGAACSATERPTYERFVSNCDLGFYENKSGCCTEFSSDIILLSSEKNPGLLKSSLEKLEKLFLSMKSSGYSLEEAVLVTNILAFVQNNIWDTIRPALDNQLRFFAKDGYGQFSCKGSLFKRGQAYSKEIAQGTVGQGLATLGKDAISATVSTVNVALKSLAKSALRIGSMGFTETSAGLKIETDGDRAAFLLITHLKTFFNVSKSVYTELAKKTVRKIIHSGVLAGYTNPDMEVAQYLCQTAYAADTFKQTTLGSFLNIMSADTGGFEEVESSQEPSLEFLGELIPEIVETLPILQEIGRVFISKITSVIRSACAYATIEVAFNNNLLQWLQHCNFEKHLGMYQHSIKYLYPMVYARLVLHAPATERQTRVNTKLSVFSSTA